MSKHKQAKITASKNPSERGANSGHKRAVLYARVSTDEQANNYSIPSQIEACRKYAESHGLAVVANFTEDYTGAEPLEKRPEGRRTYAMLSDGEVDALIVYTMDRLVRPPDDGDEWDTPILIRGLAKLGKEIHTVNRGRLGTSFAELLIAMLDAKSAGDERRKTTERTSRGRNEKARAGKIVGSGAFPYGYRKTGIKQDAALVVYEPEAKVVSLIYAWYTRGDGDNKPMSAYAIAKRLSEMGIPSPGVAHVCHRGRVVAHVWDYTAVLYILQNEVYAGVWRYGRDRIEIPVPPIIPRAVWEEAQARREYNKQLSRHNKTRQYLLSGMIRCDCGRAVAGKYMWGGAGGTDLLYYQCTARTRRPVRLEAAKCSQSYVRADAVESAAWQYVLDVITDPARFEDELRKAQAAELDAVRPKRERLQIVRDMIAEAEAEAGKLARALSKVSGGVVGQALQRQIDDVNQRYAKLTRERDRLLAEIEGGALTDTQIERAMNYRRAVIEGLKHPTEEDKRAMMVLLQVEVTVKGHTATVRCRVPVEAEPREIDLDSC